MNSQHKLNNCDPAGDGHNCGFRICGRVETPMIVGMDTLRALDPVEIEDLPLHCGSGEPKGRIGHCRGVLLADIINQADMLITDHNDTKKMFIIAASDDGYKTVFSWQEIFNTAVGDGIMVILEKNGRPLYGGAGPVDLFSAQDHLSGPRYVKQLANVEIIMVD
jgi:hypothetical protein